jgi:hypothetical protein
MYLLFPTNFKCFIPNSFEFTTSIMNVDSKLQCHIINIHRRPPSHLHDVDSTVYDLLVEFLLAVFAMEHVNAQTRKVQANQ